MSRLIGYLLVGAALIAPGSALAQDKLKPEARTGSRFLKDPVAVARKLSELMLSDYAVCMVKKRRDLASSFVTDRSALRFGNKYDRLLDPDCLEGPALADAVEMRVDEDAVRYSLAEALLRDEMAQINPAGLTAAPVLPVPTPGPIEIDAEDNRTGAVDLQKLIDAQRAHDAATIIMFKFGDCAVRANPTGARQILQSKSGSTEEGAAVKAFLPTLQQCLEKGSQVSLNKVKLRGAVATSYYSLAKAVKPER